MSRSLVRSFFLVFLMSLVLVSCQKESTQATVQGKPIQVRVQGYGKDIGQVVLEFSGTIQENRMVPIAFQVSGRTTSVLVRDGDTISQGKLLAVVDSTSFVDANLLSQAKLRQAQDAYKRMKPLHDSGSVSDVKFVELETGLAQAEALANLSKKNLQDARLVAPVSGIVVKKALEVGQSVMPGVPILSLVDARYLDAVFAVPETEVLYLRKGLPMRITVPGSTDQVFAGTITEVAIQADEVSRNYPVRIRIDNRKGLLRMGMACHGEISIGDTGSDQPTLPIQAVLEKPDGSRYVFVVRDGKAVAQSIVVSGFLGKGLRVRSGLNVGDLVVIEGAQGLRSGLAVQY